MEELKKVIQIAVEQGPFKTLGELEGMYFIEDATGLYKENDIQKRIYAELERCIPEWEKQYGFNKSTTLREVLKVL